MQLSKNKAKNITPWLNKCLDTYFAPGQFLFDRSHLVDIKWRADGYYAVMLFEVKGYLYVADVAGTHDERFEVCNDAEPCESEKAWKGLLVDPWCDGFTWKDERD